MMHLIRAGLLFLLLANQPLAAQQLFPEDTDKYVIDLAQLLSSDQQIALRETLQELEDARGIEFAVVTIRQMSDYRHDGPIEPFATGLFNAWGIGDAERNDGILLLVSRFDREMRIEVGAGYGDALNGPMQRIINKQILPYFKLDDYARGIEAGVDEVIFQITNRYPGQYDHGAFHHFLSRIYAFLKVALRIVGFAVLFVSFPFFPFVVIYLIYRLGKWIRYRWQNRIRRCPNDGSQLRRCIEETEDEHLSKGQVVEERLQSVNYDVWYCDVCDHVRVEAHKSLRVRHGACRECGFRTLLGQTRTITRATYSSAGEQETIYDCQNCTANYTVRLTIPRRTKQSTSSSSRSRSSSSSSSRGGGRSSGGGASGRW